MSIDIYCAECDELIGDLSDMLCAECDKPSPTTPSKRDHAPVILRETLEAIQVLLYNPPETRGIVEVLELMGDLKTLVNDALEAPQPEPTPNYGPLTEECKQAIIHHVTRVSGDDALSLGDWLEVSQFEIVPEDSDERIPMKEKSE